nr:MAG TPA: hypothetical protein [Caudoviricetes sp.]
MLRTLQLIFQHTFLKASLDYQVILLIILF